MAAYALPLFNFQAAGGALIDYCTCGSPRFVLLGPRLATVTRRAQRLAVRHVVP